jgi:hypothetical protein
LEASVEARHLQIRVSEVVENKQDLYNELMQPEVRTKFKSFQARLIAWEHRHIKELMKVFEDRKAGHVDSIDEYNNKTRISVQRALVDVGFYAFAKFCYESGACSEDEMQTAIQDFFILSTKDVKIQILRSSETENATRFMDSLKELIRTKTINVAVVSGEGTKASVFYTKGNSKDVYLTKYTRRDKSYYAILSFKLVLIAMNTAYRTSHFTDSLKFDLAEAGFCKLDSRNQISLQDIPDVGEFEGKRVKRARVIVIPASKLEEEESVSEDQNS